MILFDMTEELLKGWEVLVVDDEGDSLEVAQTLLEMCGAAVFVASNGQEGLEQAMLHHPRFIISDLSMPVMNGWQLLRALKSNLALQDIPVIALTAHAMTGDRDLAFGAGFHNFLSKPLEPETFINSVLNLLMDIPSIAHQLQPQ